MQSQSPRTERAVGCELDQNQVLQSFWGFRLFMLAISVTQARIAEETTEEEGLGKASSL
jgi:hypothetical protein